MAKARKTSSALPTHTQIKGPLLAFTRRRKEVSLEEAIAYIAEKFSVTKAALARRQGCGKETVLQNRLRWARWELQREGKVETTRRGFFGIAKA